MCTRLPKEAKRIILCYPEYRRTFLSQGQGLIFYHADGRPGLYTPIPQPQFNKDVCQFKRRTLDWLFSFPEEGGPIYRWQKQPDRPPPENRIKRGRLHFYRGRSDRGRPGLHFGPSWPEAKSTGKFKQDKEREKPLGSTGKKRIADRRTDRHRGGHPPIETADTREDARQEENTAAKEKEVQAGKTAGTGPGQGRTRRGEAGTPPRKSWPQQKPQKPARPPQNGGHGGGGWRMGLRPPENP